MIVVVVTWSGADEVIVVIVAMNSPVVFSTAKEVVLAGEAFSVPTVQV